MDVRNRMADVVKLRCNACQDYLKLVIKDGWQKIIYNKAKDEITTNGRYKDKYISAYEKMRDIGTENYSIEDMDVTFISEVIHGCKSIVPTTDKTRKAIERLTEDRNLTNHSNENEEDEELYLRGLLALCNLRNFVRTVDRFETEIEDERRQIYRSTYIIKIEELKEKLDEERILLIQRNKDVERDINRILESDDRLKTWSDLRKLYMNRYWKLEKDPERYNEFIVKASDAGITEAHGNAADYFFIIRKDYVEGERRLFMLFDSSNTLSPYESKHIVDTLNYYLSQGNTITEGMAKLINGIIEQGYPVLKNDDGLYMWEKKSKKMLIN